LKKDKTVGILMMKPEAMGLIDEKKICPAARPLHNAPFCQITASGSNFNTRNTQCIPAFEIIAFLVLGQNWTFFKGLAAYMKDLFPLGSVI